MSRLDNLRRLTEDGQFSDEQRQVIQKVAEVFNFHVEQIINVVNGNLDFTNLKSNITYVNVTVDANGTPIQQTDFTSTGGAIGCQVIAAQNRDSTTTYPTSTPFVTFSPVGNGVYRVRNVTGIQAGQRYRLTLKLEYL